MASLALKGDYKDLLLQLWRAKKPVIARVNGHAMGGGLGLVAASTFAVAQDDAKLGTPEINVGLFPFMIMAVLERVMPRRALVEMMVSGKRLEASEAARVGLINQAVPASELDAAVERLTTMIASKSPMTLRLGLEALADSEELRLDEKLPLLSERLGKCLATDDAREGLTAFLQKREPEMDRSLIFASLLCATACASASSEPCAPPPTPAPSHPDDLVDTTEVEAAASPASAPEPTPSPPSASAPTSAQTTPAECVVPAKTCGAPDSCQRLTELCHIIGDPIASNDSTAFVKVLSGGARNPFGLSIDEKDPETVRPEIEKQGGPKPLLGFSKDGSVRVTLSRDCTICRRPYVGFDISSGKTTVQVMVENSQITSFSRPKGSAGASGPKP